MGLVTRQIKNNDMMNPSLAWNGTRDPQTSLSKRSLASVQRNALPPCGEKCIHKLLSDTGSCHPADSWCLCHSSPWKIKVEQCFETTCAPVEMVTSLMANQNFCARLSQTVTTPAKPLPIHTLPTNQSANEEISTASVAQEAESRSNVTQPFRASYRNQTLAPHSPFESTSSPSMLKFQLTHLSFGILFLNIITLTN
ncbi:hypothetical protein VP01_1557g2 [Puccinia sorghi]|uniref:CFEM domain-containing protein n=1 Tax=Puccinia sorghi TaxID=27349 RepID=A0A0L6VI41_9BASI|nr:hypothetical protein VP01_1557g2 [Puccinia sorghi]